jgi:hypothetical protein
MTPTARTLAYLRKRGYLAGVVERYCSFTKRRHDLFGFIDIVAVRGDEILGVQATTASNLQARIAKAMDLIGFGAWLRGERAALFIGWAKPTKRRRTWEPRMYLAASAVLDTNAATTTVSRVEWNPNANDGAGGWTPCESDASNTV